MGVSGECSGGLAYAAAVHAYRWCRPPTRRRASTAAVDPAARRSTGRATGACVLDTERRPIIVVIGHVLAEQAPKMLVIENDGVV